MVIKNTIRVILADDHALVRRGVRRILEKTSTICVVGEASSGMEALRLVRELAPDVLLLDIEMPDIKGMAVARELRKEKFPVSIVILSACDDDHFIQEVLQVGVDGYLNKSDPPAKIREVVFQVSEKYGVAIASLLFLLLPKLAWALHEAIGSWNQLPVTYFL